MIEVVAVLQAMAPELAPGVIKALSGYETRNDRQLNRIEANVEATLLGPYHTARRHLQSAALPDRAPRERGKDIKRALRQLELADGNLRGDPFWRVAHDVRVTLAGLHKEQKHDDVADLFAKAAHETAVKGVRLRIAEVNRRMELTVGRFRLLGLAIPCIGVGLLVLWKLLDVFLAGRFVSHLPIELTGFAIALVFFFEFKHHYQTVVAWWFKRRLRSEASFLRDQLVVCRALSRPESEPLCGAVIRAVKSPERTVAFELWPSDAERIAYSAFDQSVRLHFSASAACASTYENLVARHPELESASIVSTLSRTELTELVEVHLRVLQSMAHVRQAEQAFEHLEPSSVAVAVSLVSALLPEGKPTVQSTEAASVQLFPNSKLSGELRPKDEFRSSVGVDLFDEHSCMGWNARSQFLTIMFATAHTEVATLLHPELVEIATLMRAAGNGFK